MEDQEVRRRLEKHEIEMLERSGKGLGMKKTGETETFATFWNQAVRCTLIWPGSNVPSYNPWMFATPRTSLAYQVSGILYQLNKTRPAFCRNARCLQYHVCKHSGALSNTFTTPVCGAAHSRRLKSSMPTFPLSASTISSPSN